MPPSYNKKELKHAHRILSSQFWLFTFFFFPQMKLGYGHTKKYTSKKEKDTITEAFQVLIWLIKS